MPLVTGNLKTNMTELHIIVQTLFPSNIHPPEYEQLNRFWTRHIVDQINLLEMVKNYTFAVSFLNEPVLVSTKITEKNAMVLHT